MAYSSFLQIFDRLSAKSILKGSTASICGLLGTLLLISLIIGIYISPIVAYFNGMYFQSEFQITKIQNNTYYQGKDFQSAVVFRNKLTGKVINHANLTQFMYPQFYYQSYQPPNYPFYQSNLGNVGCNKDLFAKAINPVTLTDCYMLTPHMAADMTFYPYPTMSFYFSPIITNPFSSAGGTANMNDLNNVLFQQLINDNYYEYYFTSKIVKSDGSNGFQVHVLYSSEFVPGEDVTSAWIKQSQGLRTTYIDDSVMPWRNNRSAENLFWTGAVIGTPLDQAQATSYGIYVGISFSIYQNIAYRYYKKLDWMLGVLGGGMFLFFIIIWLPCSYINRTLNKMKIANKLLLQIRGKQLKSDEDLQEIKIPMKYLITNLLPCSTEEDKIIKTSQNQLDISNLIKKMKVTVRNLNKQHLLEQWTQKRLIFQNKQNFEVDQKDIDQVTGLRSNTYDALAQSVKTVAIYQNNPTILAVAKKENTLEAIMEDQKLDKLSGNFVERKQSRCSKILEFISRISILDVYGAKPMLIAQPYNASGCGLFSTLLIIALSILTFALTISNMGTSQIIVSEDYARDDQINFKMVTGNYFKMAFCPATPSAFMGATKILNMQFYAYDSLTGGKTYINAVKLSSSDYAYYGFQNANDSAASAMIGKCFRMEEGHTVNMRSAAAGGQAYFGLEITPYCTGTAAYCASTLSSTIAAAVNYFNFSDIYVGVPQNKFDPTSKQLINGLFLPPMRYRASLWTATTALEQTMYLDQVTLQDDTSLSYVRGNPNIVAHAISATVNTLPSTGYNYNSSAPFYQCKIKASNYITNYILRSYKIDFLLGVIGGVFMFWYVLINWFVKLYNSFNVRAKIAQAIYAENSYSSCFFNKFLYILRVPLCMLPKCLFIREDISKMKATDYKISKDLDCLSLVKYVDNCYRLSSSLFTSIEAKNLSLLYFKQKVDYSENVKPKHQEESAAVIADQFMEFQDIQEVDARIKSNQVINASLMKDKKASQIDNIEKRIEAQMAEGKPEYLNQNVMADTQQSYPFLKLFDIFQTNGQLTLKGKRQIQSVIGGLFSLLLIIMIILASAHMLTIYLNRQDKVVNYEFNIDTNLQSTQGISLTTGSNFALAVTFINMFQDYAHNVSSYTNSYVGISLLQMTYTKMNGDILQTQQKYDLIPCASNYLDKWAGSASNPNYYKNLNLGFCVPDGINLVIKGTPSDAVRQSFKISIYNKQAAQGLTNTTLGDANLQQFFSHYNPKIYYSIPKKNAQSRSLTYQVASTIYWEGSTPMPTQANFTISSMLITYDDLIGWESNPVTLNAYTVDYYQNQWNLNYQSYLSTSPWYNISFAYSNIQRQYIVTAPKFYEVFGILGGIIIFFIFGFGCLITSFNRYKMRYLIGKQLYTFDKLKMKEFKNSLKSNKKDPQSLKEINNYGQIDLFFAYCLSFLGGIKNDYNFSQTLRRITLIQQKVEKDLQIQQFFKNLHQARDKLNEHIRLGDDASIKLTDVYAKHIYNDDPVPYTHPTLANYAKRHNLSSYEQMKAWRAQSAHLDITQVFDDKFLQRSFEGNEDNTSMNMSIFKDIGAASVVQIHDVDDS